MRRISKLINLRRPSLQLWLELRGRLLYQTFKSIHTFAAIHPLVALCSQWGDSQITLFADFLLSQHWYTGVSQHWCARLRCCVEHFTWPALYLLSHSGPSLLCSTSNHYINLLRHHLCVKIGDSLFPEQRHNCCGLKLMWDNTIQRGTRIAQRAQSMQDIRKTLCTCGDSPRVRISHTPDRLNQHLP